MSRPFHEWPEELQKIAHLPIKKWEKAVYKLFLEDEIQGQKNLEEKHKKELTFWKK